MTPIENLEILIDAVEQHPEELFDLSKYKQEKNCGTLFCTLGLAASMPEFQAQGVEFVKRPEYSSSDVKINGETAWYADTADGIFGPEAFSRLFEPADCGSMDAFLRYSPGFVEHCDDGDIQHGPNMTDKELALARLNKQLSILKEENEN